jgi:hypothetical protein
VLGQPYDADSSPTVVEDLARVINEFTPYWSQRDPRHPHRGKLEDALEHSLAALISRCLGAIDAGKSARSKQENAILSLRTVLLRVKSSNEDASLERFPQWVQDRLLHYALDAIAQDALRRDKGQPELAVRLSLMLAANFSAIRNPSLQLDFLRMLKDYSGHSENSGRSNPYLDPFLMDLVFIASRVSVHDETEKNQHA